MIIGVTNTVLSNTGDAAICAAILASVSAAGLADAHMVVFDSNAEASRRLYPDWEIHQQATISPPRASGRLYDRLQRVRLRLVERMLHDGGRIRRLLRLPVLNRTTFATTLARLEACDLVISSGGTYLVDHYDFTRRVLEFRTIAARDIPIVLWTQSMGPFVQPAARERIGAVAPLVDEVWFRDARSERAWADATAGEGPEGRVVSDVVFALPVPVTAEPPDDARPRALLSVRRWSRGVDADAFDAAAYEGMMRAGAERLESAGFDLTAISTCQGVPSYPNDDSAEARRIFAGLPVAIDRDFHTPEGLLAEIAAADVVVTTRMHLAILALLAKRPVIAIAYEFKTLELFESIGLGHLVVAIEDASERWMRTAIGRVLSDPDSAVLSDEALADLAESAAEPALDLARRLAGTDAPAAAR